ncbi:MAG TPA: galactokinase [Bacilli bacterium]
MEAHLSGLKKKFCEIYGDSAQSIRFFYAPGRVNLIGEHIDYNGGYVLPAALTAGTTCLIRPRADGKFGFFSTGFSEHGVLASEELIYRAEDDWMNYPKGVIATFREQGYAINSGYDMLFSGNIPNGAGLSSSASIEVACAFALAAMEKHGLNRTDLALLAQRTENRFVGVNCGIMDQFAVANGKKDHAVLLKCDKLEFSHIPVPLGEYKLVVANTNKRRGLVDSKYNERRSECETAFAVLRNAYPHIACLAELTPEQLDASAHLLPSESVKKRAKHVVEENNRVLTSVKLLEQGNLPEFGKLLNASHVSLRDLFEVSCRELDVMVEEALRISGVLGSRMTGAGFGGCTVSVVHRDAVEQFAAEVGAKYKERTGLAASFYDFGIGDGVKELELA